MSTSLDMLAPGEKGRIVSIAGSYEFRKRIINMGFVEGCVVQVCRKAPLGDPIDVKLKNFHVSLRKKEAKGIILQKEP